MKRKQLIIRQIPRVLAAYILIQTLWFKFGIGGTEALEESKMIFLQMSQMIFGNAEMEAFFRIGTGVCEFLVAIFIFSKKALYAAIFGALLMFGALFSHIFILGIEVNQDSGQLMIMAIITLLCFLKIIYDEKGEIPMMK